MPSDWLMADGFRPGAGGFLLDGRRERASGAYLAFRLGLDEPDVPELRVKESLPEESVALVRVLGVVPAPQLFDHDLEIGGRPFHQCPRRTQGFSKLLPEEDRVCDCGRASPTGVRLRGIGRPLRRQDDAHGPARAMALVSKVERKFVKPRS